MGLLGDLAEFPSSINCWRQPLRKAKVGADQCDRSVNTSCTSPGASSVNDCFIGHYIQVSGFPMTAAYLPAVFISSMLYSFFYGATRSQIFKGQCNSFWNPWEVSLSLTWLRVSVAIKYWKETCHDLMSDRFIVVATFLAWNSLGQLCEITKKCRHFSILFHCCSVESLS